MRGRARIDLAPRDPAATGLSGRVGGKQRTDTWKFQKSGALMPYTKHDIECVVYSTWYMVHGVKYMVIWKFPKIRGPSIDRKD